MLHTVLITDIMMPSRTVVALKKLATQQVLTYDVRLSMRVDISHGYLIYLSAAGYDVWLINTRGALRS